MREIGEVGCVESREVEGGIQTRDLRLVLVAGNVYCCIWQALDYVVEKLARDDRAPRLYDIRCGNVLDGDLEVRCLEGDLVVLRFHEYAREYGERGARCHALEHDVQYRCQFVLGYAELHVLHSPSLVITNIIYIYLVIITMHVDKWITCEPKVERGRVRSSACRKAASFFH